MGLATLAGRPFRIDPTSIDWDFKTKVADIATVGGKVVQVYGTEISDMTVTGAFGSRHNTRGGWVGGWEEQEAFLDRMKKLGDEQVANASVIQSPVNPHRFLYPPRGWDFLVYLKAFSNPNGSKSVAHSPAIINPKWTLTLFVVEDNSGLRKVAEDAYLARLSKGLGWKQTAYNGPLGILELQETLQGKTVQEYLAAEFGIGNVATGNQSLDGGGAGGDATAADGASGSLSMIQLAQIVKGVGLSGEAGAIAIAVAMGESQGNPRAHNPNRSTGDNSYGLWQINMIDSMGPARRKQFNISSNEELFTPSVNARAMMGISSNGTNWGPWSVYKHGIYRKYLDQARQAMSAPAPGSSGGSTARPI